MSARMPVSTFRLGDCREILAGLPDASIDSIVTDPPYELGFMGKTWDSSGIAYDAAMWAECLRVLKPGGHLLAFGGTRTYHRMTVAIEDAGFEIRDSIHWIYGSGFPKSLDVSKAIDKAGGSSPVDQSALLRAARERSGLSRIEVAERVGCTESSVRDWEEGRARATGRAVEFIVPSPQYREKLADLLGYSADERIVAGVDPRPIGYHGGAQNVAYGEAATPEAAAWSGWGTALKPAHEPIVVARKPLVGTVAGNVLAHGTGALNIDGCRVGTEVRVNPAAGNKPGGASLNMSAVGMPEGVEGREAAGRWPANVVLDEAAAAELDAQSGVSRSASGGRSGSNANPMSWTEQNHERPRGGHDDSGGASRFFYCAKASSKERPVGPDGTKHATVKPLALMRWLVRLVTPPGGTVLDPFAGSGTTLEAALLEGFDCFGIEAEITHVPLVLARIDRARAA